MESRYCVCVCVCVCCDGDCYVVPTLPKALACFRSSAQLAPHLYEPHYNMATASEKVSSTRIHSSLPAIRNVVC